jgi:hypothetical protein
MTNNTNPTQGAQGIPLEPLHFDTFGSTRTWDPVPALVFDRWWTLSEEERNQRFEVAFKLLMDDSYSLDHDGYIALANADPEMWWAATVIGGRTLDALERLSASVDTCRQHCDLQTAWMAIETATGFFGVAVWLEKQIPLHIDPPSEWVRTLVGLHGTEPATLIIEFAHEAGQLVLGQCVGAAMTETWSLECDSGDVFTLHLFVIGEQIPDHSVALDVVAALARRTEIELADALDRDDLAAAGHFITVGTGALELACQLAHGYGLSDNDEWELF